MTSKAAIDEMEKWEEETRKKLKNENSTVLRDIIESLGKTFRSNRQKGFKDEKLEFLYKTACGVLFDRDEL